MGNKQVLEAMVHLENCDLIGVIERWWDELHNWSKTVEGYKLFGRDRQGRSGRRVWTVVYSLAI